MTFWTFVKFAIMLKLAFLVAGFVTMVLFLLVAVTWKILDEWWRGKR